MNLATAPVLPMVLLLLLLVLQSGCSYARTDTCSVPRDKGCDCTTHSDGGNHINCHETGFKDFPTNFTNPTTLDLTENSIWVVERVRYPTLKQLRLGKNEIREIEDHAFRDLADLTVLNLAHNHIRLLTDNTFLGLQSLELLNLEDNELVGITSKAFTGAHLPRLQFLRLSRNRIHYIEAGSFAGLSNLYHLNVSYNRIQRLSTLGDERGLPRLSDLDLSGNRLRAVVGSSFRNLKALTNLFLNNNHITQLGIDSFHYNVVETLKSLWLRHNFISHLDAGIMLQLETMSTLDVSHNLLESLNVDDMPDSLDKLIVHDNPWNCSVCENRWIVENAMVRDWNKNTHVTCAWPDSLWGINVYEDNRVLALMTLNCATSEELIKNTELTITKWNSVFLTANMIWIGVGFLCLSAAVNVALIVYARRLSRRRQGGASSECERGQKDDIKERLINKKIYIGDRD